MPLVYYSAPMGISKGDKARLNNASELAKLSTCSKRHGAIIIKGGAVQAVGVNSFRNDPLSVTNPSIDSSIHAEEAALKVLNYNAVGAVIYVARVNNQGQQMQSKPCDRCMLLLKNAGVKKIYWTIDKSKELN